MHSLLRITAIGALLGAAVLPPVVAQSSSPAAGGSTRSTTRDSRRTAPAKGVLPDPTLFDGAPHPAEQRAERGMLGEFEMEGKNSDKPTEKVGGNTGLPKPALPSEQNQQQMGGMPQGGGAAGQQNQPGGGKEEGAGGQPPKGNDPNAKAEGVSVGNLENPGGAAAQDEAPPAKPTEMKIGDATLQVQAQSGPQQDVVGAQAVTGAQQRFEKPVGNGKYLGGDNTNKGVEKGRTMPPGM